MEINTKQTIEKSLKIAPCTANSDHSLHRLVFYMKKFDTIALNIGSFKTLLDNDIKTFIESLMKRTESELFIPTISESVFSGFSMPTKIFDLEARVTTYCANFFKSLESVGCGDFPDDNPKKFVQLL